MENIKGIEELKAFRGKSNFLRFRSKSLFRRKTWFLRRVFIEMIKFITMWMKKKFVWHVKLIFHSTIQWIYCWGFSVTYNGTLQSLFFILFFYSLETIILPYLKTHKIRQKKENGKTKNVLKWTEYFFQKNIKISNNEHLN